ncbi:MAG: hypothetical protein ACKVY0_13035 [Prosthecobacter sp.]|uniref:hypothetical protein n=1 Tax=Prosthecobacter sp. TaxID=1965333 RepID=UPI0038FE8AD3
MRASLRYVDDFEIISASGAAMAAAQEDEFVTWLSDKLAVWSVEDFEAECVWDDEIPMT